MLKKYRLSIGVSVLFFGLSLAGFSRGACADEFEAGASTYNTTPPRYTDEYIQIQIQQDMEIACHKDRCVLASVTSNGHKFTTTLTGGVGNQGNFGNSSVVVVGGQPANSTGSEPYVSLTLQYTYSHCTQVVSVPKSLYVAMNTYLYHLINEEGSTRKTFSPAEQTMILFYSTILEQAKGCSG